MAKSIKKIFCPNCRHFDTRINTKLGEFVCNHCGHKWKKGLLQCPDCLSFWIRTNARHGGEHICRKCGKAWIPTRFERLLGV